MIVCARQFSLFVEIVIFIILRLGYKSKNALVLLYYEVTHLQHKEYVFYLQPMRCYFTQKHTHATHLI